MAKITTGAKTVTAAGTRERLIAVASNVSIKSLTVAAKQSNTGAVYLGADDVASTNTPQLDPGDAIPIEGTEPFNLSDVYIDAEISGEGVDYVAIA